MLDPNPGLRIKCMSGSGFSGRKVGRRIRNQNRFQDPRQRGQQRALVHTALVHGGQESGQVLHQGAGGPRSQLEALQPLKPGGQQCEGGQGHLHPGACCPGQRGCRLRGLRAGLRIRSDPDLFGRIRILSVLWQCIVV